jgi:hypothetical protein
MSAIISKRLIWRVIVVIVEIGEAEDGVGALLVACSVDRPVLLLACPYSARTDDPEARQVTPSLLPALTVRRPLLFTSP